MPRPGPFQGAGARRRRGPRGVHVVENQDDIGHPSSLRDPESPLHVPPAGPQRESCLGCALPVPQQQERVEGPAKASGEAGPDEGGEVASPPEIFPGAYGYRYDRRRRPVRKQVPPRTTERVRQTIRHRPRGEGSASVFRRQDGGSRVSRVEKQGAAGVERRRVSRATGGGEPEIRDPPPHRRSGQVRRRAREKGPETGRFRGEGAQEARKAHCCAGNGGGTGLPEEDRGGIPVSGRLRRWRTPGFRGRWRSRSRPRRKNTGRST